MFKKCTWLFKVTAVAVLYAFCVGYLVVPKPLAGQNSDAERETGNENTAESVFDAKALDHSCVAYMLTHGPEAVAEADTVADSLSVEKEPGEFVLTDQRPKKEFVGTTKDIVIAVVFISGWLVFMWIAANQKTD